MRPTKYNKRITIQQRTSAENEIGGWSNEWTNLFTCWASVLPMKGFKRLEYAKTEYSELYEVEMRKRQVNPDGDCRIVYDGNNYQIIALIITDFKVNLDIAR